LVTVLATSAASTTAYAIVPSASGDASSQPLDAQVIKLLRDADGALKTGNLNLALIQLKNAVRLAPQNGEVRARLGLALLEGGDAISAERELRQARNDKGPDELVVPGILQAMLMRGETKELLAEFRDPPQATQAKTAADVLRARAIALELLNQKPDANAAMDRSLSLRRDAPGLIARAKIAREQNDLPLARRLTDEANRLAPNYEEGLIMKIALLRQDGETQTALATADELVKRSPQSITAKILRVEVQLDLKQDPKAKEDIDAILKQNPKSVLGIYYRAVLTARAKDFKGAWQGAQSLPPEFIQSQPQIAMMVAQIAIASGNAESGGAILATLLSRNPDVMPARLQLAGLRLSQGSANAAIDALGPLKTSDNPQAQALLAQAYLLQRDFRNAIAALEKATASGDGTELLKRQLALSELQVGNTDEGIQGLRDLLDRNPEDESTAGVLIGVLMRAGKLDDALVVADRMAKSPTKSPLPGFYRAQILIAQGNLAGASAALGQALAADPKFTPALYYRANVSIARGNLEDGTKDLQQVLTQDPNNVLTYVKLAQIALANGQDALVASLLNKAISLAPNNATPRLALANYQIYRAKYQEAQATIDGLLKVLPNNAEALALQGQIQFARGEKTQAVATFRALAVANPQSSAAQVLLAKALNTTQDRTGALVATRKAIALAPASTQTQSLLIELQIAEGKTDDALATARGYASAYPGSEANLMLANTLIRLKRTNEATTLLERSLASKPNSRLALRLSQIAKSSGDSKRAIAVLSSWLAKNPNDFDVRRQYASLLLETGDQTGARREFEVLLKQRPEDPVTLNNLGWILQKDDPTRALSLVSLAAKIMPLSSDISDTLGWMKFQRQDYQGALPLLQRAHDLDAENGWIGYHLALALDATGKRAEAKTLLQAVLAKNPKFEDVEKAKQLVARW